MRLNQAAALVLALASASCAGRSESSIETQTQGLAVSQIGPPSGVPTNYVFTHHGFFHPSCVIHVNNGETINSDGDIIQTDGQIRKVSPCPYQHFDDAANAIDGPLLPVSHRVPSSTGASEKSTPVALPDTSHGTTTTWLADFEIDFSTSENLTWFSSDYTVPPKPSSNDGQDVALWGGVESHDKSEVIQPILDKGDYYDSWAVRGENCCLNGNDYTGAYYAVNVGDTISGYAYAVPLSTCTGYSVAQWEVGINVNGSSVVYFDACEWNPPMTQLDGGVLEVYHVVHCTDLPQSGTGEAFNDISAYNNGSPITLSTWTTHTGIINPGCSPGVSASGNSGGIWWRDF